MKKRYITFKSIDSLVNCYIHHQIIQYSSEVGVLFTVKFRPPGSPFPKRRHLSVRITSFKHVNNSTDTSSLVILIESSLVILIDKRCLVGKGLPGGRNLIVNSTPTSEEY